MTNTGSGELENGRIMRLICELGFNNTKTLFPGLVYFSFINLTTVKDVVSIVGGVVAIVCTVLVSQSTIRKNNRGRK